MQTDEKKREDREVQTDEVAIPAEPSRPIPADLSRPIPTDPSEAICKLLEANSRLVEANSKLLAVFLRR